MKLTKEQRLHYTEKMKALNINQRKVYNLFKEKKITYTQIHDNIDYGYCGIRFNITGDRFNPKILIDIYEYLSSIKTPNTRDCFTNLKPYQKNLNYLLNNGFGYSEAIMIAVMKTCNKCGIEKEESEYHKRGNALKGTCKTCRKEENKKVLLQGPRKNKTKQKNSLA